MEIQKLSGFARIYQAECFSGEVNALFGKSSGDKRRYLKWLFTWLSILDIDGKRVLDLEQFEYIQNTTDPAIYAIRHPHSLINERYLFVFTNDESSILLTAFKEKSAKDYQPAIARAKYIFAELED